MIEQPRKIASKRDEAASEKALHRRMVESDAVHGGLKGGVAGTALGAGLRHLGHAGHGAPLYGAALGTALGSVSGYHHGKERQLRDTVQQERQHMRTEARTKKSEHQIMMAAFEEKVAAGLLTSLGQGALALGTRGARALGAQKGWGQAVSRGRKFFGGGATGAERMSQAIGAGGLALGGTAALAGGAGMLAGNR